MGQKKIKSERAEARRLRDEKKEDKAVAIAVRIYLNGQPFFSRVWSAIRLVFKQL